MGNVNTLTRFLGLWLVACGKLCRTKILKIEEDKFDDYVSDWGARELFLKKKKLKKNVRLTTTGGRASCAG